MNVTRSCKTRRRQKTCPHLATRKHILLLLPALTQFWHKVKKQMLKGFFTSVQNQRQRPSKEHTASLCHPPLCFHFKNLWLESQNPDLKLKILICCISQDSNFFFKILFWFLNLWYFTDQTMNSNKNLQINRSQTSSFVNIVVMCWPIRAQCVKRPVSLCTFSLSSVDRSAVQPSLRWRSHGLRPPVISPFNKLHPVTPSADRCLVSAAASSVLELSVHTTSSDHHPVRALASDRRVNPAHFHPPVWSEQTSESLVISDHIR